MTNHGVAAAHGRVNGKGPGHNRPNKEAGNNRAGALDQGPNVVINVLPCRKRLYGIEKLNCTSETYGHRNRQTARGFANRASNTGINPLTKTHKRGRKKLK